MEPRGRCTCLVNHPVFKTYLLVYYYNVVLLYEGDDDDDDNNNTYNIMIILLLSSYGENARIATSNVCPKRGRPECSFCTG